jgi:hypothetical protein
MLSTKCNGSSADATTATTKVEATAKAPLKQIESFMVI